MKKQLQIFLWLILITSHQSVAQSPSWLWAHSPSGSNSNDAGKSVTTDGSGNVYVTGYFYGPSITFGTTTLNCVGLQDMFLVKYDSNGNALWAKSAAGSSNEVGYSVTTDGSGNVFVTGYFNSDSVTFGITTLNNTGVGNDMFIVKYDSAGNVLWAHSAGGSLSDAYANSITTDSNENAFVTGYFSASITFGTTTLNSAGQFDMFIVKYDSAGNALWAKRVGGNNIDNGYSITVDADQNAYVTGYFYSSTITFGTSSFINAGGSDIFIVKYDSTGNILWAQTAGGNGSDFVRGITTDNSWNVYLTGYFASSSIVFGTDTLNSVGYQDMFIVRYDSSGNVSLAKSEGENYDDAGYSVITDINCNIYVAGHFQSSSITFGTTVLNNAGLDDMFLVKYTSSGNVLWAQSAGGTYRDVGNGISINANGNVYVTGSFQSSSISFGSTTLLNNNFTYDDMFIAKLDTLLIPTGNNEIENFYKTILLFPNPATNYLNITLQNINKKVEVTITDITGKIIYKTTATETQTIEVNTRDLAAGIYLVRIQTAEFSRIEKLIIAR